jgi:hypothetical protein
MKPEADNRATLDVTLRHITFTKNMPVPLTFDDLDEAFVNTTAGRRYKYALAAFLAAWQQHEDFLASRPTGPRDGVSAELDLHGQLTAALVLGDAARKLTKAASSRPVRTYAAKRRNTP